MVPQIKVWTEFIVSTYVLLTSNTCFIKKLFSEIQHCGKREVNREKGGPDVECLWLRRRRRRHRRQQRSCWVGPWLFAERRLQFGHYDRSMEDQQSFFNFLRMLPEMFDELLNRVRPRIRRADLWVACVNEKISTEVRIFGGILFRRNGRNVNVTGTY